MYTIRTYLNFLRVHKYEAVRLCCNKGLETVRARRPATIRLVRWNDPELEYGT